jgi:hypothetical protein
MPLRDHFRPPWSERYHWEGFHSAWVNTIVRSLNTTVLPDAYRAEPQVHLGARIEADVATWESPSGDRDAPASSDGDAAPASWSPAAHVETAVVDLDDLDVYEVRIVEDRGDARLAAVLELVSPANKDRPEHRAAFTAKCIAYLRRRVSVIVVDVVTERRADLHEELLRLLAEERESESNGDLYSVAYRSRKEKNQWRLDFVRTPLEVGQMLPTVPLWLNEAMTLPLDLEATYEETVRVLRIR